MIPLRSLTILFGPAGLGKTTYSVSLAAAVTRGKMTGFEEPRNVLISSQEDDLDDTLVPRAIAAGADLSRIGFLQGLDLPSGVETLRERVRELRPGLLIIDPISSHLDTTVDSHKNAATRRALSPIADLAADLEFAVLAVAHPNKATAGSGLDRLSGSSAFGEAARSVIVFGVDPSAEDGTEDRVIAHLKSNKGPKGRSIAGRIETVKIETKDGLAEHTRLTVTGLSEVPAEDLLRGRQPEAENGSDPRAFLDEALANGPVPTLELQTEAKDAGVSWRALERVKKQAGVRSVKQGGSWYWARPEREAA
jgi:putative DNA primase/helicase